MSNANPLGDRGKGLEEKWAYEQNQKAIKAYQDYLKHKSTILEHLKTNKGATAAEISEALGIDIKTVERALKELAEAGVVSKS
jgi:predicted transcriptional regulator